MEIELNVSQAEDWGVIAKLSLRNSSHDALHLGIRMVFGGISRHGRTYTASYFDVNEGDSLGNSFEVRHSIASLDDSDIRGKIHVWSDLTDKPKNDEKKQYLAPRLS